MLDYANVLVNVVAILGVINRAPAATLVYYVCYPAVAHILTQSVHLAFGPKSGLKKCRARAWFGLQNEARSQL